jgi:hypothetical protein
LKYIPKWKMCGDKACYEFNDAWKLIALDLEIDRLTKLENKHAEIKVEHEKAVSKLKEALNAEKTACSTLQSNNERLNFLLTLETTRATAAEARPGPFPAWAIAGGVGLAVGVIAGVVLGVYVTR